MARRDEVDIGGGLRILDAMAFGRMTKPGERRKVWRKGMKRMRTAVARAYRASVRRNWQQAGRGVKLTVYRNTYGASVSLQHWPRKAGITVRPSLAHRRPKSRSGIRRRRRVSARTKQMRRYFQQSASYLLRWVNSGTDGRTAGTRGWGMRKAGRGQLTGTDFFGRAVNGQEAQTQQEVARLTRDLVNRKMEEINRRNR